MAGRGGGGLFVVGAAQGGHFFRGRLLGGRRGGASIPGLMGRRGPEPGEGRDVGFLGPGGAGSRHRGLSSPTDRPTEGRREKRS